MGSINFLSTANFSFTVVNVTADSLYVVEVKPTSKEAKALYRFKQWGKVQTIHSDRDLIFSDAEAYEEKVMQLAAI